MGEPLPVSPEMPAEITEEMRRLRVRAEVDEKIALDLVGEIQAARALLAQALPIVGGSCPDTDLYEKIKDFMRPAEWKAKS